MKKLFLLPLLALCITGNAQLLDFGVMGGVNFPNLKIEAKDASQVTIETGSGYHVGVMARINLVLVFVQPELLYTNCTTPYSYKYNGTTQKSEYNLQRLDVPIPVGLKLGPVGIFVGPEASFTLTSPDDIFNDSYKKATWGYVAGANVKFLGFLVEGKFEGPLSDVTEDAEIGGVTIPADTRQPMWTLSVGYFF